MAVNVSTITSVCVYCKADSATDFHEINDEVGRELQLPTLVKTYFRINVKHEEKQYLCDDCVNRLIELYDMEEHAKEESLKETNLKRPKNVNVAAVQLVQETHQNTNEIWSVEKKTNRHQNVLIVDDTFQINNQNVRDREIRCTSSSKIIQHKEFFDKHKNMIPSPVKADNEDADFDQRSNIVKISDCGQENAKSTVFIVEHLQNEDDIEDIVMEEDYLISHENEESQESDDLTYETPIEIINSNEAESQDGHDILEDIENKNLELENLYNTNNEDVDFKSQISSIEEQLSETEIIKDNNEVLENVLYEELDATLMGKVNSHDHIAESKEMVIADVFNHDNYDEGTTTPVREEILNEIANSTETINQNDAKTIIESDCQFNKIVKYDREHIVDNAQDENSNDSISLEEEYLIEEISCSEEHDEVDLNAYLDKVLNTKFQDLELKWETECKLCSSVYNTFEDLLNHSCINGLEEDPLNCIFKNCEEPASNLPTLARHLILNHYDKLESAAIYGKCPDCQKTFSNILDFNKHSCCRNIKRKTGSPNYCQSCDMDFQSLKRYVFHMQFHLTNRRPKVCLLCGVFFKTSNDFFEHTQYQHVPETAMACTKCDRFFKEKEVFEQHMNSHDTKYHYSCTFCPRKYTNKFILAQHLDIYHSNKASTLKCEHCQREFVNRVSYRNHIKCHDSDVQVEAFICSNCGIVTSSLENIKYHIESDEDSPCFLSQMEQQILGLAFTCENCSLDFHTINHLKHHRLSKNHSDDLFVCGICRQSFKTLRHMRNHCTNHKDAEEWKASFPITRYFVCNIGNCQEFYPIWTTLYYHKKRPHKSADKPVAPDEYKCQFCQQVCSSKMSLAVHVARSHNNSNVKCSYCKRSFKSQKHLQEHIDKYHTPVQCHICLKQFKHRRNLDSHNNMVHLSIKRYFCKYCAKGYFHKSEKDIHEKKVHPKNCFKCELCNFATTYPESLQVHMDKHNNQLKFKCTICGKAFGRKQLLKCHLKRHLNKKDFSCAIYLNEEGCDGTFLTHNLLKRHIQTKHPNSTYNKNLQKDEKLKPTLKSHAEIEDMGDNSYELWQPDEDDGGNDDEDTVSEKSSHMLILNNEEVVGEQPIELVFAEEDLQFDE